MGASTVTPWPRTSCSCCEARPKVEVIEAPSPILPHIPKKNGQAGQAGLDITWPRQARGHEELLKREVNAIIAAERLKACGSEKYELPLEELPKISESPTSQPTVREREISKRLNLRKHTLTRSYSRREPSSPANASCLSLSLRVGVHSIQNCRDQMEDTHCNFLTEEGECPPTPKTPGGTAFPEEDRREAGEVPEIRGFFGVFDGHGGRDAAEFVEAQLFDAFIRQCHATSEAWNEEEARSTLRKAFQETEGDLLLNQRSQDGMDGTTAAVTAVLESPDGELSLLAGNVGDSEVLLGRGGSDGRPPSYLILSELHCLSRNSSERSRVEAAGGRIFKDRLGHPKLNPRFASLAVSRAMGDIFFKDPLYTDGLESGLCADPFVVHQKLSLDDNFVILGCDGFFDSVDYQEAVEFAFASLGAADDPQKTCEALVELAQSRGSKDNITVVLVLLDQSG
mmetsp:Transcript_31422/g.57714  ORF Transcript_31422/g.57714 Transcript_31422/m.57714 type:complete len:455 (-) Transcript_31422:68-1432(-)